MALSENEFQIATALGRIEGKLETLCGPDGRIKKLEDAQTRQWWYTVAVLPFVTALSHIMRTYFKLNI